MQSNKVIFNFREIILGKGIDYSVDHDNWEMPIKIDNEKIMYELFKSKINV